MSEITITIPSTIANQHLPLLIERLCKLPVTVYHQNNDKIKDIVARLYVHCQRETMDPLVIKKLLGCLSNNAYHEFRQFLDWIEQYEVEHCIVLAYLSQRVNTGVYASIVEDDDFNQKLVDLLVVEEDDDLDDVLRSYHANKNNDSDSDDSFNICKDKVSTDFLNQSKANSEVMPELNETVTIDEISNADKAKSMMDNMDEDKFESILSSLGLDEVGMTKARKIKADVQSGKQLNMMEVMAFAQEYKSNIDAANLDIGKLMGLIFSQPNTTTSNNTNNNTSEALPFDMSGIMNMLGPILNNLGQQKKGKRPRRR